MGDLNFRMESEYDDAIYYINQYKNHLDEGHKKLAKNKFDYLLSLD